jgi:hypothetical protein
LIPQETKAQLDPTVGQSDIQEMKCEIHRMEVRYGRSPFAVSSYRSADQLEKQKEQLIQDMEMAVYRRETIVTKAKIAAKTSKTNNTQAAIQKEVPYSLSSRI